MEGNIRYVGVKDRDLKLFEGQYPLKDGVTYNSYIIMDEKITIMDSVDKRAGEEWLKNVKAELNGKEPYYLVISHMEPDHSANIKLLADTFPNMKLVGNIKTFMYLNQMFKIDNLEERKVVVNEGDELDLGEHKLKFIMAPMIHWPEVMFSYEEKEKILFSADAFGTFGCGDDAWPDEARRYYINIVGKYGAQVQAILTKLKNLEINGIYPLHGEVIEDNLEYYIEKYNLWSKYEVEEKGVLIAYSSMHGNTKEVAYKLKEQLKENNINETVEVISLNEDDITEAVSLAFKYDRLIVASPTYNGELFPATEMFLKLLKSKGYQKRKVGFIENGTWAPLAAKQMKEVFEQMKEIEFIEPVVSIKTTLNEASLDSLKQLAKNI